MADRTLAPRGLPYGENRRMADARSQAGLTSDPSAVAARSTPRLPPMVTRAPGNGAPIPTPPVFDPLLESTPGDLLGPGAADPQTLPRVSPQQMPVSEWVAQVGARSASGLGRVVAERIRRMAQP